METSDPRAAFAGGDVTTRSAAARDLALCGTLDDLATLIEHAQTDKSSAVRLYSAAAAADIVSRYRSGGLPAEVRTHIEEKVGRADPARNPSLLMLLSPFPERGVIARLARMLRDPRTEVRAGAAVALRRMALSSEALEMPLIEALVGDVLKRKLTPDATFEIVKLAGELGWTHLDDLIRGQSGQSEQLNQAVDECFERNRARKDVSTYSGYWVDQGLDVQQAGVPEPAGFLAIVDGVISGPTGRVGEVEPGVEGRVVIDGEPARLLWAAPPGLFHERVAVLQTASRAWWRQEGAALQTLLDGGAELPPAAFRAMVGDLEALEGAAGVRARLIASFGSGDLEEARAVIEQLTGRKKPRNDLWFWKAAIYAAAGEERVARTALATFLAKAKKKAPLRPRAEALAESLGD